MAERADFILRLQPFRCAGPVGRHGTRHQRRDFDDLVNIDKIANSTLITIDDDGTITLVRIKNGIDINDFILV